MSGRTTAGSWERRIYFLKQVVPGSQAVACKGSGKKEKAQVRELSAFLRENAQGQVSIFPLPRAYLTRPALSGLLEE